MKVKGKKQRAKGEGSAYVWETTSADK